METFLFHLRTLEKNHSYAGDHFQEFDILALVVSLIRRSIRLQDDSLLTHPVGFADHLCRHRDLGVSDEQVVEVALIHELRAWPAVVLEQGLESWIIERHNHLDFVNPEIIVPERLPLDIFL